MYQFKHLCSEENYFQKKCVESIYTFRMQAKRLGNSPKMLLQPYVWWNNDTRRAASCEIRYKPLGNSVHVLRAVWHKINHLAIVLMVYVLYDTW